MTGAGRKTLRRLGLTGILALLSYTAAVVLSPLAYPGYDWMAQAVSDLSAQQAPSRMLWARLAAPYDICSVVCATCVWVYAAESRAGSRLFRTGIGLFTLMTWISAVGYGMFPLADAGTEIGSFSEGMHLAVTAAVVILSVVSLVLLTVAGCRHRTERKLGIWAALALIMMTAGSIGTGTVPPRYFGIAERCSVFAAVGFNAVLGWDLFRGSAGLEET